MIIAQSYPMWLLEVHGTPTAIPIIAWRITEGDVTAPPVPITPGGEVEPHAHGGYYDDRTKIEHVIWEIQQSRNEHAAAQAEPRVDISQQLRDRRSGEATF